MTRRYNKRFPNDGRFSMCFSGPLSIPKVALRFLIGFCVWNLRGKKKIFLEKISGRSNTKKPTENIMVEPICPCESAADFASKVWLSVPLSAKIGLDWRKINSIIVWLTSRVPRFACSSSSWSLLASSLSSHRLNAQARGPPVAARHPIFVLALDVISEVRFKCRGSAVAWLTHRPA